MRVEGVGKLFKRPFVEADALARVIFLFEMEHRRLRLETQNQNKNYYVRDDYLLIFCTELRLTFLLCFLDVIVGHAIQNLITFTLAAVTHAELTW